MTAQTRIPWGSRTPPIWILHGDDRHVADYVAAQIRGHRLAHFAIAGGKTPKPILDGLARRDLPWDGVTICPTDERLGPLSIGWHSNFGMIRDAMQPCPARIEPLSLEMKPTPFDLVWLGMGDDGKIASLFTTRDCDDDGTPAVKFVHPNPLPPRAPYDRLSLNISALAQAREMILVIRGEEKLRLVKQAIAGRSDLPLTCLLAASRAPWRIFWSRQ